MNAIQPKPRAANKRRTTSLATPALLFLLGGASACAFLDARIPCEIPDECPSNETCSSDGFCNSLAAQDGGSGRDAGGPQPEPEPSIAPEPEPTPEPTPSPTDAGADAGDEREPTDGGDGGGPANEDAGNGAGDAVVDDDAGNESEEDGGGEPAVSPPDSGVEDDAGLPTDAGANGDAGVPIDAGTPQDAGTPTDAGKPPEDAGLPPVDAGQDAGPLDAGPLDAGPLDAGAPVDAGVCIDDGIVDDPLNCGACGYVCASGSCATDVCRPQALFEHNGKVTTFGVDWIQEDIYLGDEDGRLYAYKLNGLGRLLATNVDVVAVVVDDLQVVAASDGPGQIQLLTGILPVTTLGSMVSFAAPSTGHYRAPSGRAFGLSTSPPNLVVFGHDAGDGWFDTASSGFNTRLGSPGRYGPVKVGANQIVAANLAGTVFESQLTSSPLATVSGSLDCGVGALTDIPDSVFFRGHAVFAADCGSVGVGFFDFNPFGATTDVPLTLVFDSGPGVRIVAVTTSSDAIYAGIQNEDRFSIYRVVNGGRKAVVVEMPGLLIGVEGTNGHLVFAAKTAEDSRTAFFRVESIANP